MKISMSLSLAKQIMQAVWSWGVKVIQGSVGCLHQLRVHSHCTLYVCVCVFV